MLDTSTVSEAAGTLAIASIIGGISGAIVGAIRNGPEGRLVAAANGYKYGAKVGKRRAISTVYCVQG